MMRDDLRDSIRRLESRASTLEPDAARRRTLFEEVGRYAEEFLERLPDLPAFVESEDLGIGVRATRIGEEGQPLSVLLEHLGRDVDRPGLNPASGGHLGYIPGGGLYASSLADYLAAVTNRYAGIFFASPGAVRMENLLLEWMSELVGYPKASSAGNLTSGGSIANLIGV
ncbi:MAG: pyridoxal phosphate-dependent decarboxylase family protein, partial [Vicinamibacteria bacterium]